MGIPFLTVDNFNRSLDDFIALLRDGRIDRVTDIRTILRSRTNPQFNRDTLPDALAGYDISYDHMAALGGLRGKARTLSPNVNAFWDNESFHNYVDYALSEAFYAGRVHLLDEGRKQRCVIMCSEAVWWRCHRRIVADCLIAGGQTVVRIMGQGRLELAHLTSGAVILLDDRIIHPARQAEA